MKIRKRNNRTKYWIFRVSRKAYRWQVVKVRLPFFRELVVWRRAR